MTENTQSFDPPQQGDPRYSYAMVTSTMRGLLDGTTADQLANATPCSEFTVKELMEHIVLVQRRVAAIGSGEHWSSVQQEAVASGWADQFGQASHDVMTAWGDPATLDGMYEVPWATLPGAPLMSIYTGEMAVHAWDLATATGQAVSIGDDLLRPSLEGARMGIPSGIRGSDDVPFDEVVDPGPDAPVLLQLAGWLGRNVLN